MCVFPDEPTPDLPRKQIIQGLLGLWQQRAAGHWSLALKQKGLRRLRDKTRRRMQVTGRVTPSENISHAFFRAASTLGYPFPSISIPAGLVPYFAACLIWSRYVAQIKVRALAAFTKTTVGTCFKAWKMHHLIIKDATEAIKAQETKILLERYHFGQLRAYT